MAKSFNRTRPLTKVQKEVMARVEEKALYPQLRRLYWYGEIDDNNPEQVLPSDTPIVGGTWILEAAGVIGY